MLRGVNKKVIVIRNPPGDIFEEAYFILKSNRVLFKPSADDLVLQANKLLASCSQDDEKTIMHAPKGGTIPSAPDFSQLNCPDAAAVAGRSRAAAHLIRQEKKQLRRLRACLLLSFVGGLLLSGIVGLVFKFYM